MVSSGKLKNLTLKIGSGSTPRGGKSAYLENGRYKLIRSQNIYNHTYNPEGLAYITEEQAKKLNNVSLQQGDILINITGDSVARTTIVENKMLPGRVNQHVSIIRCKENLLDPYYLLAFLTLRDTQNYLLSLAQTGGTRAALTKGMLEQLELPLLSYERQKKLGNILKTINEKININNLIILSLEQLSQTLFKQWFIDFEFPNEEGKPYKSSGGEMVESVMGKIPINWSISKIETIAQFKNGKKITSDDRNETGIYKIFGSNGVIGYTNKTLYSAPSLVIGRVGANCGSMELSLDPCWISDNAIMCAPKNMIYYNFLYILLKKIKLKERAGGSAQPLINQSILKGLKFILPSESLVKKFHSIAYKNTQLTENLKKENEKLAEIRDTLLPKLLSGEIEIPDDLEV